MKLAPLPTDVKMNKDQRQDGMRRHVRGLEVEKPCAKVVASGSEQNIVKVGMITLHFYIIL